MAYSLSAAHAAAPLPCPLRPLRHSPPAEAVPIRQAGKCRCCATRAVLSVAQKRYDIHEECIIVICAAPMHPAAPAAAPVPHPLQPLRLSPPAVACALNKQVCCGQDVLIILVQTLGKLSLAVRHCQLCRALLRLLQSCCRVRCNIHSESSRAGL